MRRLAASWIAARRHRGQKGQTLIIMAFLSVFLITLLGLVVDSVRLYVLSAQAERAAEAAALAGALYMPSYFSEASPAPDGQSAQKRACDVLQQNGITNCPAAAGQVGAQVTVVPTNQYEIQVTVTLQSDVFFLAFVSPNLSTTMISRSALAEFLPPIELGSRTSYFGDQADGTQSFWASINGPSDLKEQGDAYTPTLEEGPTDAQAYPDSTTPNAYNSSRFGASFKTNHQQYGQCSGCPNAPIANPDVQPSGFTGYNYQIIVPAGSGNVQVKIYNPEFNNDTNFCTGSVVVPANSTGDTVDIDAGNSPTFGCSKTDKINEYMQMTYTLYSAPLLFERSQDTLLTTFSPPSLDKLDSSTHCGGNPSTPYWNPQAQTCVANPGYINQWYSLYTITSPGIYRLSVNATGFYGAKNYGVKLTDAAGNTPPSGVRIFAWNNMCVYFDIPGNGSGLSSVFDLGEIPADYAGKTLNFSLFDPGEGSNNIKISILDPTGTAVQLPAWVRTVTGSGGTQLLASSNGDRLYNGLWLNMPISIPASYNPASGSDWWQIKYVNDGTSVSDKITISISLSGSPIHLVNELP